MPITNINRIPFNCARRTFCEDYTEEMKPYRRQLNIAGTSKSCSHPTAWKISRQLVSEIGAGMNSSKILLMSFS